MDQANIQDIPSIYPKLVQKTSEIGFDMPSDIYIGTLLKSLCTSKPHGNFLELGTGMGLSLAWMVEGMDSNSTLTSVDKDPELISLTQDFFQGDVRLNLLCAEGEGWISTYEGEKFDLIFADAWPGKYSHLNETLDLLKSGGFYVVDDLRQQPNWPNGHQENVDSFLKYMDERKDFAITKMDWSTGVLIAVKK